MSFSMVESHRCIFIDAYMMIIILLGNIHARILLHDTQESRIKEQFDCIYYTDDATVQYCRRSGDAWIFNGSNEECLNDRKQFSFQHLLEQNTSPEDALEWSSSIERADDYASIFYAEQNINLVGDEFLCHCARSGTFGKYCQYNLLDDATTFEDLVHRQFKQKEIDSWVPRNTVLFFVIQH